MKINSDSLTVLVLSIILVCMIAYLLIWPPYRTEGYINDSHQTSKQTEFSNNRNGDTNNRNVVSNTNTECLSSCEATYGAGQMWKECEKYNHNIESTGHPKCPKNRFGVSNPDCIERLRKQYSDCEQAFLRKNSECKQKCR